MPYAIFVSPFQGLQQNAKSVIRCLLTKKRALRLFNYELCIKHYELCIMHYELLKTVFLQEWLVAWLLTAELLVLYHTFVVAAFL